MLSKVNPLAPSNIPSFAEGGSLLAPEETPYMEEEMDEATPMDAVAEIIGEDRVEELYMAIEAYPIVGEIVNMAIHTQDGAVSGVGGPTDDEVPARLSPGEFVIPAGLVQEIGAENLQAMLDQYHARQGSMAV